MDRQQISYTVSLMTRSDCLWQQYQIIILKPRFRDHQNADFFKQMLNALYAGEQYSLHPKKQDILGFKICPKKKSHFTLFRKCMCM